MIFSFRSFQLPISSPPKDPGSSGVETTSWPGRAAAIVGGLSGFSVLMVFDCCSDWRVFLSLKAAGALATSAVGALSLSVQN